MELEDRAKEKKEKRVWSEVKKPGILGQEIRYPMESLNYLKAETAKPVSHLNISFPIVLNFRLTFGLIPEFFFKSPSLVTLY